MSLKTGLITEGKFYKGLKEKKSYDIFTQECIEKTVENLISNDTTQQNPGMMLGKIQSGKTQTFIGVTGLALDNNYEVAIILTKGTIALAFQTYERVKSDFNTFIENEQVQLFDIMNMPNNLTKYELNQKLIIVAKKQTNNLSRLEKALTTIYPNLKERKTIIIDDEADYASIGFKKTKKEIYEINKIAVQIDSLRQNIKHTDYLQVTATPYSLYLQPENEIELSGYKFKPVKPSFTVLVPYGSNYIGGEYYFQESQDDSSLAFYLHQPIDEDELIILKKKDGRRFKLEDALISSRITSLRDALVNFIVGGVIRRLQNEKRLLPIPKYSFIIHTEQAQASHSWQRDVVLEILDQFTKLIDEAPLKFNRIIKNSYENLSRSLNLLRISVPQLEDVIHYAKEYLQNEYILVSKVNSKTDINELLDDNGQLKLRVPLNIFIGGQILDRGITISNLIGFYYGRSPQSFQQDTVLQHSRMYGYRDEEDLAVTRFYTTSRLYQVMKTINDLDETLRKALENHDRDVVFIQRDTENKIIPCSPNKVLLSKITSLQPHKRLLPVGMQTFARSTIERKVIHIDKYVENLTRDEVEKLIDLEDALKLIEMINETFDPEKGEAWDVKSFISSLEFLSKNAKEDRNKIWLIVRKNRNISRVRKSSGRYEDAPDTPRGQQSELRIARELAKHIPSLIILRQEGKEEKGWRGCPFWWPVLVTPSATPPVIFANETIDK